MNELRAWQPPQINVGMQAPVFATEGGSMSTAKNKKKNARKQNKDHWHRRQALQLAAQLPERPADARRVIAHLARLQHDFLE
jgi:hypothetical protein